MVILTYNIWAGGEERLGHIADVIRTEDPDAVALLEATPTTVDELAHALEMNLVFGDAGVDCLNIAWLTRLRVEGAVNHNLPALAKTLLEIEVGETVLFATHLASRHEGGTPRRVGEIRAILDVTRARDRSHLLVGDFNALQAGDPVGAPPPGVEPHGEALPGLPRGVLEPLVVEGYVDCYRWCHPHDPGYTYTAERPWLRLDYAFASRELAPRVRKCDVVNTAPTANASDHLPLRIDLG